MLPYLDMQEAEAALGRELSFAEKLWFNYSAKKHDYFLHFHNFIFLLFFYSLIPLPYLLAELIRSKKIHKYKIQPKVKRSFSDMFNCYKNVMQVFLNVAGPLQIIAFSNTKMIGIRTSLPLPSKWEMFCQILVYFIVEDYFNYWIHRWLHTKWGYEKIHHVHHEYTAPFGFAAPYAHWAEILILGLPSFLGPAFVPGHIITYWLWFILRQIESIETHSGDIGITSLSFTSSQSTSKFLDSHHPGFERNIMLPYLDMQEAEAALGRELSFAEKLWFNYSAKKHDYFLHFHNFIFLLFFYSLIPLPYLLAELIRSKNIHKYKIQPKVKRSFSDMFNCYKNVMQVFLLVAGPLQIIACPIIKMIGIRTSLPLPSKWEMFWQILAYFIVEDYFSYWIHRWLHTKRGYEKIHHVHHEYTAPFGFAAHYAHWAELLILGLPSFLGPVFVPGHIITYWLWFILRHIELIETHGGYEFPWSPSRYIPFYGGSEFHDYHHYIGGRSQSNFASVFTYCDYIYGTDKGYRYHKSLLRKKIISTIGSIWLHTRWGYEKIHHVHHEYGAPIAFAAPYAQWPEILILGTSTFLGPVFVPGLIVTFMLWLVLRQIQSLETHSG
ncbi:hypothetical protein EZV62_009693 [Acer yangbiense]|uniref:Fatty acid hydroxylase domain-containing protein n=1 Tax=Acer yangbiense TaxID=1000413 RepID=A0A5C7I102_9ROSI|nr:hypothetical protein EZV62_009693 [Acer yangbiense]